MIRFEDVTVGSRFIDENHHELMVGIDDVDKHLIHVANLTTGIVETNFTGLWIVCDVLNNRNARILYREGL